MSITQEKLEQLIQDTRAVAYRWSDLFDETDDPEVGAAAGVMLSLSGALRAGEHSRECLLRLSAGAFTAARETLARVQQRPS